MEKYFIGVGLIVVDGSHAKSMHLRRVTDDNGRCGTLMDPTMTLEAGYYKMMFDIKAYNKKHGLEGFYPYAEIVSLLSLLQAIL